MNSKQKQMKLPKVASYVRNVGKSVAFVAIEGVKQNTPNLTSFTEANEEVFRNIYSQVKDYKNTIKNTDRKIRQSEYFKAIEFGTSNMLESIKTGNFYLDKTDEIADDALGFSDDMFSDYDSNDSSSSGTKTKSISDSFNDAIGAAASGQATMVAKGTDMVVRSTKASTTIISAQIERSAQTIHSGIGAVYNSINHIHSFLNGPMMAHLENSKNYYENSLKIMQDQQGMMKEILEMQRNLYKREEAMSSYRSSRLNDSMNYNGSMNVGGYMKNIKSNISSYMDMYGLGMLGGGSGMGNMAMMSVAAAPFKFMLDMFGDSMLPKKLKRSLKNFDNTMSSLFSNFITKMNKNKKSDNGFLRFLGSIFGIDIEDKKTINTGNYNKGAVPFDGITRKTIIEVIPGYLARIESALTGKEERYFDADKGIWKNSSRIRKDFDAEKVRAVQNGSRGISRDSEDLIRVIKRSKGDKAAKDMENVIRMFSTGIFDNGGLFEPSISNIGKADSKGRRKRTSSGDAWKKYGFKNKADFDLFLSYLSDDTYRSLAADMMNAKQGYSRTIEGFEKQGGIYNNLFSGAIIDPKDKKAINAISENNILTLAKDENGKNIFYYLREILDKTSNRGKRSKRYNANNVSSSNRNRDYRTKSSSTSSTEETESAGDSSSDPDADLWAAVEAEEAERQKKIDEENAKKHSIGTWIKEKLGNSPLGKALSKLTGGASAILAKPVEYMTKLLDKADRSMFSLMFGDKHLKDKDGNEIKSVFQYMIDNIKSTFEDLKSWMKTKLFDPVWDKLKEKVRPVTDELMNMGRAAKDRVKKGLNNTFGKLFDNLPFNIKRNVENGGVSSADDVEAEVQNSARGRIVTKRGLTMISPGEIIIPASFDKKKQDKMLRLEKRDRSRIYKAIGLNATGTVNQEQLKATLVNILNENSSQQSKAKIGASGIIGAGAGLLVGNPLLGAMAGAGLSILKNSESFQKIVFGEETADGHKEGLIPSKIQNIFKKALPDMGDYGIAGGLLGLFTPFGLLGGAAIGAGVGYLKNSESFKKFIFGNEATGEDGLISKESYEKFTNFVKKSAPRMLMGAGATILTGPFGLLGNAALGAGFGLISSTDQFHDLLFGNEKEGKKGVLDALNNGLIQPAKKKLIEFAEEFKKFARRNIIEPMKDFWKPVTQGIKNVVISTADKIKDHMNDMFEKTIGLPLHDFLQEKIFKPVGKLVFGMLKAPVAIGKAMVAAPFRALGGIGNTIRAGQIRRGTAYDMSASERLAWRDKHKIRFNKLNRWRDSNRSSDEIISGMSIEDLQNVSNSTLAGLESYSTLQKRLGSANKDISMEISNFFNEDGRFDRVGYSKVKKIVKLAEDGKINELGSTIDKLDGLSPEEKESLMNRLASKIEVSKNARKILGQARDGNKEMDANLTKIFGRKIKGRSDKRKIYRSAEAELKARKKRSERANESPEVNATNNFAEMYKDKSDNIIKQLIIANDHLKYLVDPNADKNDTTPPGDEKAKKEEAIKSKSSTAASTKSESVPDNSVDMANPAKTKSKKKGALATIWDTVTGRFITSDPDAKENVENEKERARMEKIDAENTAANKKTNSILGNIKDFFTKKKDDGKDKNGFLSKIKEGFKKFGKIIAGIGATAVAVPVVGYASEWFKTDGWPKIKEFLFGTTADDGTVSRGLLGGIGYYIKTTLLGNPETGEPGLIEKGKTILLGDDGNGGVLGSIKNWFREKYKKVKSWYDKQGGFSGIVLNKIVPGLIRGWGYAINNLIAPLVTIAIRSFPTLLGGLVKAIVSGIGGLFNKKIGSRANIENSEAMKALREIQNSNNSSIEAGDDTNVVNSIKSSFNGISTNGPSDVSIDFDYINKNDKKAGGLMGLLGATNRTNKIEYDENGNIITEYTNWNTSDSLASRFAKATGRGFINGLAGISGKQVIKNASKNGALSRIGGILNPFKKAKAVTGVIGKGFNLGKNALKGSINIGNSANELIENIATGAFKEGSENVAVNVAKNKGILSSLMSFGKKGAYEAVESGGKYAAKNAGKTGILSGLKSLGSKGMHEATEKGGKYLAKAVGNVAGEAVEKKGLVAGIKKIFKFIANSPISEKIAKCAYKMTGNTITSEIVEKALMKIGTKLGDTILAKATKGALKGILGAVAKFSPIGIAFLVADFLSGYNNANTILGIADGDETFHINFGHKCLCGLINLISQNLTLGLVPADFIVDIVAEFLFPIFKIDAKSFKEARDNAQALMDKWNMEHADNPDMQFDNLEDFNNKDKWWFKASYKIKKTAKSALESVKKALPTSMEDIKPYAESMVQMPKFMSSILPDVIHYAKTGEHLESVNIDENDPLKVLKKIVLTAGRVINAPIGLAVKLFTTLYDKVFAPIGNGIKNISTNVFNAYTRMMSASMQGDIRGAFSTRVESNGEGGKIVSGISNVVFGITKILNAPTIIMHKGVSLVKDGIDSMIDKFRTSENTKLSDDNKIRRALNGSLSVFSSEYWKNADHSGEGIFGVMSTVQTYIQKILTTPIALVNSVFNGITNKFEELKESFKTSKIHDAWVWFKNLFGFDDKDTQSSTSGSSTGGWKDGWHTFTDAASDAWDTAKGWGSSAWEATKNTASNAWHGIFGYGRGRHNYQDDPSISGLRYGDSTIGEAGCAPVAAANVVNGISNKKSNVMDAAKFAERNNLTVKGGGTDINFFNKYFKSKGIDSASTSNRIDVMNALKSGNQVVMLGKDNFDGPGAAYGSDPHFITAKYLKPNGNIVVEDPDLPYNEVEYRAKDVINPMVSSVVAGTGKNLSGKGSSKTLVQAISDLGASMVKSIYGADAYEALYGKKDVESNNENTSPNNTVPDNPNNGGNNNPSINTPGGNTDSGASSNGVPGWWSKYPWVNREEWRCRCGGRYCSGFPHEPHEETVRLVNQIANHFGRRPVGHSGLRCSRHNANEGGVSNSRHLTGAAFDFHVPGIGHRDLYNYASQILGNRGGLGIYSWGIHIDDRSNAARWGDYAGNAIGPGSIITDPWESNNGGGPSSDGGGGNQTQQGTKWKVVNTSTLRVRSGPGLNYPAVGSVVGGDILVELGRQNNGVLWIKHILGWSAASSNGVTYLECMNGSYSGSNSGSNSNSGGYTPGNDVNTSLGFSANEKYVYNYLKRNSSYTPAGIAGLMANLNAESSLRPNNVQDAFEYKVGNDATYTSKVNNRSYTKSNFMNDGVGYGLAQWTWNARKANLYRDTVERGKSIDDFNGQLQFLLNELRNSFGSVHSVLRSTNDPVAASDKVLYSFEAPADPAASINFRRNYAKSVMNRYGRGRSDSGLYKQDFKNNISYYGNGRATEALNKINDNKTTINNNYSIEKTSNNIDYTYFLKTIVEILVSISSNTAILTKILNILSTKMGMDISMEEVKNATTKSRKQAEEALNKIMLNKSNASSAAKILGDKDTQYIVAAMAAIAGE